MLQQPRMCSVCGKNFEYAALQIHTAANGNDQIHAFCPHCMTQYKKSEVDKFFPLNLALRNEIEKYVKDQEQKKHESELKGKADGGASMPPSTPYTAVFVGASGVGKSKTINRFVGHTVTKSISSGVGVTQETSVVFNGLINERRVMIIDTPGLFDPDKSNVTTLSNLTSMLQANVVGVDTIFHVVRKDRINELEMEVPAILLAALGDGVERARLLKRYRIVVTRCDSDADDDEDGKPPLEISLAVFRGGMHTRFPSELKDAIDNAIYIENQPKPNCDISDPKKIRTTLLNELIKCRELKATCFLPKQLSDVIHNMAQELDSLLEPLFGKILLASMPSDSLGRFLRFFKFVSESGKWVTPRADDNLPDAFVSKWNELSLVGRDKVALDFAKNVSLRLEEVVKEIAQAAKKREEDNYRKLTERLKKEEEAKQAAGQKAQKAEQVLLEKEEALARANQEKQSQTQLVQKAQEELRKATKEKDTQAILAKRAEALVKEKEQALAKASAEQAAANLKAAQYDLLKEKHPELFPTDRCAIQ